MWFYTYTCNQLPSIHKLSSGHVYTVHDTTLCDQVRKVKVFSGYTLFLQLMKRMKILFTIKRQTPLSTTVITSYMDLKLLSWFVKPVPSTACMLHYLLYESKIQITIRAGHKRVSGIWRMSRFLHVQCNLYQLLISNILFWIVIEGPLLRRTFSHLHFIPCQSENNVDLTITLLTSS